MQNVDNLKYCVTKDCSRFNIIIASYRKRCEMCDMRLKHYKGTEKFLNHDQQLVIVEGATRTNDDYRCVHDISVYKSCKDCGRAICSVCQGTPLNPKNAGGRICLSNFHPTEAYKKSNGGLVLLSGPAYQRYEDPGTFHVDCDINGDCPIVATPLVHIPFNLFSSWLYLTRAFDTEWMAYLGGTPPDADKAFWWLDPKGMYFPDQECTAGHVSAKRDCEMRPGTIAAVHSHVDFQASFSPEDEKHFNFPIEIVVNRGGNMDNVVRIKLDCGRFQRVKAKLMFVGSAEDHALRELLQSKITIAAQASIPPQYRDAALFHSNKSGRSDGKFDEAEYWRQQDRFNRDTHAELDDRRD